MEESAELNAREILEVASRSVVAVVGICFALGLLVVNLRLARFGIFTAGFVRTEYVLTGALLLFLVALAWGNYFFCVASMKQGLAKWRAGKRGQGSFEIGLFVFAIVATPAWVISIFSEYRLEYIGWRLWLIIAVLYGSLMFVGELGDQLIRWLRFRGSGAEKEMDVTTRRSVTFFFIRPSIYLLLLVSMYANIAYPYLSPAFGGGRKDDVYFVPKPDALAACRQLGLPMDKANRMGPLQLLTETDDAYYVVPVQQKSPQAGQPRSYRLRRELFAAVVNVTPRWP